MIELSLRKLENAILEPLNLQKKSRLVDFRTYVDSYSLRSSSSASMLNHLLVGNDHNLGGGFKYVLLSSRKLGK